MSNWTEHEDGPYSSRWGIKHEIIPFNENEILVIQQKESRGAKGEGIYKYTALDKQWTKVMEYSSDFISTYHSVTFDSSKESLYLCNYQKKLLEINTNTKNIAVLAENVDRWLASYPSMFCVADSIHIINGGFYKIFDKETKQFVARTCNYASIKANNKVILHTRNGNIISLSYSRGAPGVTLPAETDVVEYSRKDNIWTYWDLDGVPRHSLILKTENEDYLIFVDDESRAILVLDIETMVLVKSEVKTPSYEYGVNRAVMLRDAARDNLLVSGHIRKLSESKRYKKFVSFPVCLVTLIANYTFVCNRMHLFGNFNHWSINVDEIMRSVVGIGQEIVNKQ